MLFVALAGCGGSVQPSDHAAGDASDVGARDATADGPNGDAPGVFVTDGGPPSADGGCVGLACAGEACAAANGRCQSASMPCAFGDAPASAQDCSAPGTPDTMVCCFTEQ